MSTNLIWWCSFDLKVLLFSFFFNWFSKDFVPPYLLLFFSPWQSLIKENCYSKSLKVLRICNTWQKQIEVIFSVLNNSCNLEERNREEDRVRFNQLYWWWLGMHMIRSLFRSEIKSWFSGIGKLSFESMCTRRP